MTVFFFFIADVEGSDVDKQVLQDFVNFLYFDDIELDESNVMGLVQCCKQFSIPVTMTYESATICSYC